MEVGEEKDENLPAPLSSVPKAEEAKEPQNLGEGTEINNELEQFELTSKKYIEELASLLEEFKLSNKNFLNDTDEFKENLLKSYSQLADPNEKLSLKNKKLDSDIKFKSLCERPIQTLKYFSELYASIFDNVKSNLKILFNFLKQGKKLKEKKPLQDFFTDEFKNIVDCWLFIKLDFDNFNVNEALAKSELNDSFKSFITKIYKKKSVKICIERVKGEIDNEESKKKFKEEKKMISENMANATKFFLKNTGELRNYWPGSDKFPKLKKFEMDNGRITDNYDFNKVMPELEKFTIKSSFFDHIGRLETLPKKLKQLYLEKCNLVNSEISELFKFYMSKELVNNLEVISLEGNNITKVDFSGFQANVIYQNLVEMNFKKNKLYKFIYNPENFPKIKFINCSKNNFNKSYLKDMGKVFGLESGNGFLFEPDLCKNYYTGLKSKISANSELPYVFKYLNITFMPKYLSLDYFVDFALNEQLLLKLKKLDLSYNSLNCATFFSFLEKNKIFENLVSLNLNGNELDDTFFEKCMKINAFPKLEHLYLNSNRIGDLKIKVDYKDDVPIDKEYQQEKDKNLVYKLRLIYKFIEQNVHLNKLTLTKNPISEFYTVVKGNNADKDNKFIKRDLYGKIAINCLFSMLVKIRDEILTSDIDKERRKGFNLRFDCRSNVNKNSENYPYGERPFVKKM